MSTLKPLDLKILSELMKNSKISDRTLAKKLGVSQPTVTRRRAGLEKKQLLDYTVIPNLKKLGYGIIAITFIKYKPGAKLDLRQQPELFNKKIRDYLELFPNIILMSSGSGLGFQGTSLSVHRTYSEYIKFRRETEMHWSKYINNVESFVISVTGDNVIRLPSFEYFADYIKNTENLNE